MSSNAPRLHLERLVVVESMSEETVCFNATLFDGDRPIGYCRNDGHGGCTFIAPVTGGAARLAEVEEWARTLPPAEYGASDGCPAMVIPSDLEHVVDNLVEAARLLKDYRRAIKSRVLVAVQGKVYELRRKGQRTVDASLIERAREKWPQGRILNTLPEAEGLDLYRMLT